jgi:tetratricopeptide (TPR) repeat protein
MAYYDGDFEYARQLTEESIRIFREIDRKWNVARCLFGLGKTELATGNREKARSCLKESLSTIEEIKVVWGVPYLVEALGSLAQEEGLAERAAQLFAATESICNALNMPLMPRCRVEYEQRLEHLRSTCDEEIYTAAWQKGYAMTSEAAVAYALQE